MAHLGSGASSADHRIRLSLDTGEDTMKKRRHAKATPKRVKRKKGIISRVISGGTKAVSKAWN